MRKIIFLVSFLLIVCCGLYKGYTSDWEKRIEEILTVEEWNKYQELKQINDKLKENSKKYWQAVGPHCNVERPDDKEKAQKYKEEMEKYDKIREKKMKEFLEMLAPQKEKIFLLAIEIDKHDSESAGWFFSYGFSDIRTNPETLLKIYLYYNKHQTRMREELKNDIKNYIFRYLNGTADTEKEKILINYALSYIDDLKNSPEDKKIIIQFLWDTWNGLFPRVEKMDNREEIYEEMNKQVIQIVEKLKNYLKDSELGAQSLEVLNKFEIHYSRQDLPQDFKNTPSYIKVLSILKK